MSNFTPTVKFELDFDGDHLIFELRRLKVKHRAVIMRASQSSLMPAGESETLLAEAGQAILPECVVAITGFNIQFQAVNDIKVILEEAYFLPLVDKLLAELIRISRVQEIEAKNSDGLLGDTSRG